MSESLPVSSSSVCPQCGTALRPDATMCWLCRAQFESPVEKIPDAAPPSDADATLPAAASQGHSFSLATLMMLMTLICVVLGVASLWPGLGVPLGVLSFIIWLRTANVVKERSNQGETLTSVERIRIFLSSVGTTVVILMLIGVTGAAALCTVCGTMFSVAGEKDAVPFMVGGAIAVVVCILVLRAIFRFINR